MIAKYIERKRLEQERELKRKIRKDRISTIAKVVTGSAIGAGLGVLFAPKSGKETREDIKNATVDGVNYISENANNIANKVKEKSFEIRDIVVEKYEEFSDRNMTEIVPEILDEVEEKVEEVKGKVEEVTKELKEKISE